MSSRGRTFVKGAAFVALLLVAVVACTKTKVPASGQQVVDLAEIESKLGHSVARPDAALGAVIIQSGLLEPAGGTFKGASGASSYRWKQRVVILRQGRPAEGWTLRGSVHRPDAVFQTRPDGAAVALLPPAAVGGKAASASAYVLFGGWLVQLGLARGDSKQPVTFDELKTFVAALRF